MGRANDTTLPRAEQPGPADRSLHLVRPGERHGGYAINTIDEIGRVRVFARCAIDKVRHDNKLLAHAFPDADDHGL